MSSPKIISQLHNWLNSFNNFTLNTDTQLSLMFVELEILFVTTEPNHAVLCRPAADVLRRAVWPGCHHGGGLLQVGVGRKFHIVSWQHPSWPWNHPATLLWKKERSWTKSWCQPTLGMKAAGPPGGCACHLFSSNNINNNKKKVYAQTDCSRIFWWYNV